MNQLIILPGNSPRNKEWGEAMAAEYGARFDEVYQQDYDHWQNGEAVINFEIELEKLSAAAKAAAPETILYVFAKSAGTLLTLIAVQRGLLSPRQCIFFGMPLEWADRDVFKGDWSPLSEFSVPTLAFHNDNDPIANYDFTKNTLAMYSVDGIIGLVTTTGDNHDYFDFAKYEERVNNFLSWG